MKKETLELRVLAIQEPDGSWTAQCLEYDIVAQAKKLVDLGYEFEKSLIATVMLYEAENRDAFKEIPKAPQEFWNEYEEAGLSLSTDARKPRIKANIRTRVPQASFKVADGVAA